MPGTMSMIINILIVTILAVLVVYSIVMVGLMSSKRVKVQSLEKETEKKKNAVKTIYQIT